MNMLRVWGGGFYEEERFYDLCDRYGILVWQDFIFSCSTYPDAESFFENVRAEAVENIRRLRHRASLALWCGNNEMEWGWEMWSWNKPEYQQFKAAYDRMFHHFLPEICAGEDPDHAYWPSSPSSNTPFTDVNGGRAGDTHCWDVWHGMKPFGFYRQHATRFVSEFGFQSLPPLATVRTYAGEADWNMTSYMMEHHQRNAAGNGKIITYLTDHFRLPKDFTSLVYLSQLLQAECVRTGVEHWRRSKQRVGGALYWQLNDCWPVASWASLDYFGRWKALHYAARRFYAPVLLSAEEDGSRVALYVTSDLTGEWRGTVRWSLETLAGEARQSGEEAVSLPALGAAQVCALDLAGYLTAGPSITVSANIRRDLVLVYELWQSAERLSIGVLPFVPSKHLELDAPQLRTVVRGAEAGFAIEVTAKRLARFVWLELDGADAIFSDNCFDLPAGRTVTVTLPALEGWTLQRVRESLRVRSLVDSF
jgi:beta-mannosidase